MASWVLVYSLSSQVADEHGLEVSGMLANATPEVNAPQAVATSNVRFVLFFPLVPVPCSPSGRALMRVLCQDDLAERLARLKALS